MNQYLLVKVFFGLEVACLGLGFGVSSVFASPEITPDDIRAHVYKMASPEFEGRLTGSQGEKAAIEYLQSQFVNFGLHDFYGETFQPRFTHEFRFLAPPELGSRNALAAGWRLGEDWVPFPASQPGSCAQNHLLYAGYGYQTEEQPSQGLKAYDSYAGISAQDQWVVIEGGTPRGWDADYADLARRQVGLRARIRRAITAGARGLFVLSDTVPRFAGEVGSRPYPIPILTISRKSYESMLSPDQLSSLQLARTRADAEQIIADYTSYRGFAVCEVDIQQDEKVGTNVVGKIPATLGPARGMILVGGHLDHLGHGEWGNSRAKDSEKGQIHFGADDNASGTSGVLEIAEYIQAQVRSGQWHSPYDIVFGLWSGEELGLLGSQSWIQDHLKNSSVQGVAYLNMDMIGRLRDQLDVQGLGSSLVLNALSAKVFSPFALKFGSDPYLPTDAMSFYLAKIPVVSFFTGVHEDYHTPRDRPETLDYEGTAQVVRYVASWLEEINALTSVPDYVELPPQDKDDGSSGRYKVLIGTIPDFGYVGDGFKIAGTQAGSPAQRAGLKEGDIIIEIAGKKISNIYDYMDVLTRLEPGVEISLKFTRVNTVFEVKLTPEAKP